MTASGRAARSSSGPEGGLCLSWAGIAADPFGAAHARVELARWLQLHFVLTAERLNDIVLAVNEALANAADYAYAAEPGTMDMDATYDSVQQTLAVTIADRGTWRPADSPSNALPTGRRGRGIALIHALADRVTIETADSGTEVTLVWNAVLPAGG